MPLALIWRALADATGHAGDSKYAVKSRRWFRAKMSEPLSSRTNSQWFEELKSDNPKYGDLKCRTVYNLLSMSKGGSILPEKYQQKVEDAAREQLGAPELEGMSTRKLGFCFRKLTVVKEA